MLLNRVILWFLLLPLLAGAADNLEEKEWLDAGKPFQDRLFAVAEEHLSRFLQKYPNTVHRNEAVLNIARCRYYVGVDLVKKGSREEGEKKFSAALALLQSELSASGAMADRYRFWIAETEFQRGNLRAAADTYGRVASEFPESQLVLQAAFSEALAWFKMDEYPRVIELLSNPVGAFQSAVKKNPSSPLVAEGMLLRAESFLASGKYADCQESLILLQRQTLSPSMAWRQNHLLCRLFLKSGKPEQALDNIEMLHKTADALGEPEAKAESLFLEAEILESTGQLEAAIAVYERNLEKFLETRRRNAVLKLIQLNLANGRREQAAEKLSLFLAQNPADAASDLGRLVLGEMRLAEFFAMEPQRSPGQEGELLPAGAAKLQEALQLFNGLLQSGSTNFAGRAHLNKAWCHWARGEIVDCQTALVRAVELLHFSEDQAVGHFKLADTYFVQQKWTNAIEHYEKVIRDYSRLPRVKDNLVDQALYQLVRVSLVIQDEERATGAMRQILSNYPESYFSAQSTLLVGQYLNRVDRPAKAREVFEAALGKKSNSLEPEIRVAIARTHVQEENWSEALTRYHAWVEQFPQHPARTQVEFDRAWVSALAGESSKALQYFSNFASNYPSHSLAPMAQIWVGDHYFQRGKAEDNPELLKEAERAYLMVMQTWPETETAYQAQIRAAKTAISRYSLKQAAGYLTNLFSLDTKCPTNIVVEAYFAYGDLLTLEPNEPDKYAEAYKVFQKIPLLWPDDPLAPAAYGKMGDCQFQLGGKIPESLQNARTNYQNALQHPRADLRTRSLATIGLGNVDAKLAEKASGAAEKERLLENALKYYLEVVYAGDLRSDGSGPDPFYQKEAGLAAMKVLEEQKKWKELAGLCHRLASELPALESNCRQKLASIAKHLAQQ